MKKIITLVIISMCFLSNSKAQSANSNPALAKLYEGCCGTKPVEFKFGSASVYIPNVFTPNGDGLNDIFMPYISNDIVEIQDYSIMSANGDTLLFQRPTFVYSDFEKYAWNGNRFTGSGVFASEYMGLFKYGMRIINSAGRSQIVEGEACVIRCGKESKIFKNKDGCYYPEQAQATNNNGQGKGVGKVDKSYKTKEQDCF